MKKKELGDEKVMQATAEANKRMSEPMKKAIADVKRLREEREAYKLDVAALQECKAAALVVSDRLDALRWEHEIMGQRYERLVAERDALARKFREAVQEVQQKAGFKALLLEQKLAVVVEEKEKAQGVLGEVLSAANLAAVPGMDAASSMRKGAEGLARVRVLGVACLAFFCPTPPFMHPSCLCALTPLHPQTPFFFLQRDEQLEDLRQQLEAASAAYDGCIASFRGVMHRHSIPEAEIGIPLASARDILLG